MYFQSTRWQGNNWAAITITPASLDMLRSVVRFLEQQYDCMVPPLSDRMTGFFADFVLDGVQASIDLDDDDLSLAFADDATRDRVLNDLRRNGL